MAGLLAGLLGIGGGAIMAPLLLFVFESRGEAAVAGALSALATSVTAMLFTALPSFATHAWHGSINWRHLLALAPAASLASLLAVQFAVTLPAVALIALMIAYLGYSALKVMQAPALGRGSERAVTLRAPVLIGIGCAAGLLGPVTGTGGGVVTSASLLRLAQPVIHAIGTSSGVTLAVAVTAAVGYANLGGGYVRLGWVAGLAPACVLTSIVGARLANRLPPGKLRLAYIVFVSLILLRLSYSAWERFR